MEKTFEFAWRRPMVSGEVREVRGRAAPAQTDV